MSAVQESIGFTLEAYSQAKGLPIDFLKSLGLTNSKFPPRGGGNPAIKIPYYGEDGEEVSVRYRIANAGDRFRWKPGSKVILYGLQKLKDFKKNKYVILVEGESDTHTLLLYEYPVLGLPGAGTWRNEWANYLKDFETIYIFIELDAGGETVLRWIEKFPFKEKIKLVTLGSVKDVNELHLQDSENFKSRLDKALTESTPWEDNRSFQEDISSQRYLDECQRILKCTDILSEFSQDLTKMGYVGDLKSPKLLYLILVSRLLKKPVSVSVKGTSSGGKSFLVEMVLAFFPASSYFERSSMSEKVLIFSDEPLSHRHMVLYEAAGLTSEFANYIIRSLLSEGCIKYEVTIKNKSTGLFETQKVEKEGPTGLVVTTTATRLHPENETRMLSIEINDTPEQTKGILRSLANENATIANVNLGEWHSFQEWLGLKKKEVHIPFGPILAELTRPYAVRLRRDFSHLLNLIRCHALLHQKYRKENEYGQIIAEIQDYKVVKDLIGETLSHDIGAAVSSEICQTVNAVIYIRDCDPLYNDAELVTIHALSKYLNLDVSTVRRRVYKAIDMGFLENEALPNKQMRLKVGIPIPSSFDIFPSVEALSEAVQACVHQANNTYSDNELLEERAAIKEYGG